MESVVSLISFSSFFILKFFWSSKEKFSCKSHRVVERNAKHKERVEISFKSNNETNKENQLVGIDEAEHVCDPTRHFAVCVCGFNVEGFEECSREHLQVLYQRNVTQCTRQEQSERSRGGESKVNESHETLETKTRFCPKKRKKKSLFLASSLCCSQGSDEIDLQRLHICIQQNLCVSNCQNVNHIQAVPSVHRQSSTTRTKTDPTVHKYPWWMNRRLEFMAKVYRWKI